MTTTTTRRALIFPAERRIGCVLLQAGCGADSSVCRLFDIELWQTAPMSGGVVVSGTTEEWKRLAELWNGKESAP